MSWSISAGGTPAQATESVNGAHVPDGQEQGEIARQAILDLLAAMPADSNVSVSAAGHHDARQGNVQLTVAYSPRDPAPAGTAG